MAKPRPTVLKRQKERRKQEKKAAKQRKKEERKAEKQERRQDEPVDEDPDIAGIVPGPQPKAWELEEFQGPDDLDDEADSEESDRSS